MYIKAKACAYLNLFTIELVMSLTQKNLSTHKRKFLINYYHSTTIFKQRHVRVGSVDTQARMAPARLQFVAKYECWSCFVTHSCV